MAAARGGVRMHKRTLARHRSAVRGRVVTQRRGLMQARGGGAAASAQHVRCAGSLFVRTWSRLRQRPAHMRRRAHSSPPAPPAADNRGAYEEGEAA
jgi:hypothetical protein